MNSPTFLVQDFLVDKKPIGLGSFSKVFKAKKDNNYYAIKQINIVNKKNEKKFQKEFDLMRKLDHINIIKMHNIIINNYTYYLVLDYHEKGDLSNILNGYPLTEQLAQNYATQLKNGLEYLYKKKIIHRDLKPQNILVSNENILKITDFGFARYVENQNTLINTMCGSPLYMAPEILKRNNYNNLSDLWSVGLIIYQMLVGYLPFNGKNFIELINNIKRKELVFPKNIKISDMSKNLVELLVVKDPKNRCTWETFFYHDWFKIKNSITLEQENRLIDIDLDKVPSLDNFSFNKSLSYVYKSQFDEELSFTDAFHSKSTNDSFLSAESTESVKSEENNTQSSYVLVDKEEVKKQSKESFKRNVKNYLYSSLNFVKESYDYISQSNSL